MKRHVAVLVLALACAKALTACGNETVCGPRREQVTRVIDGDTVELLSGDTVRYLLIDTPELHPTPECYATHAAALNRRLVEGRTVELSYDEECSDAYGRLLAYVSVDEREVNSLLVERGYACVLHIPPNGEARVDTFRELARAARDERRGLWGSCTEELPACTGWRAARP